jgi:ABC-type uncharacterized transport system fused permease/ATPase subunit
LIYVKCKSNNREVRQLAFLPQRPYLPLGTLRNALSYSSPSDAFPDADVGQALDRCDLGHLVAKLDKVERWDNELSLGEQERLAFAAPPAQTGLGVSRRSHSRARSGKPSPCHEPVPR